MDASFGFRKLVPYLDSKFKIFLLDVPSFGKSKIPENKYLYRIDLYAKFIYESIKVLNLEKIILVGHSMGGLLAQHISILDLQNRIQKLVLLSSGNSPHPEREKMRAILFPKTLQEITRLLNYLYYEKKEEPSDFIKKVLIESWNTKPYQFLAENTIREEKEIFFGPKAKLIKNKTLIITGEEDEITTPLQMKKLHSYIKNSKLVFIPKAKHAIHLEHPEKIASLIYHSS